MQMKKKIKIALVILMLAMQIHKNGILVKFYNSFFSDRYKDMFNKIPMFLLVVAKIIRLLENLLMLNKTYDFNPHIHVKIWLSTNPDIFLNQLNQLRLIRMRVINPHDTIHLVYESRLLSAKAVNDLESFCAKHSIIPHDILKNIIPTCKTDLEKQIISIYEDERMHLHEGGNVASMSDLMRIIEGVYTLGVYSDFDVHVDTRALPDTLKVKEAVLINDTKDSYCNDVLIVTDPVGALSLLQVIKRAAINACLPQSGRTDVLNASEVLDYHKIILGDNEYHEKLFNTCLNLGFSARQYKYLTATIDQNFLWTYIDYNIRMFFNALNKRAQLRKEYGSNFDFTRDPEEINCRDATSIKDLKYFRDMDRSHFNRYYRARDIKKNFLKSAVMCSTGPTLHLRAIMKYMLYNFENCLGATRSIGRMESYGLYKHFQAQTLTNCNNDCSWLQIGVSLLAEKEDQLDKSAKKIRRFFEQYVRKSGVQMPPINSLEGVKNK